MSRFLKFSNFTCKALNLNINKFQLRSFSTSFPILHESSKQRFISKFNGSLSKLDYHIKNNTITFIHTEVPEILMGKGVGRILAQEGLKYARDNNLKVKIECDYMLKYFTENADKYKEIIVE